MTPHRACVLAGDVMQDLADRGALGIVEVGSLSQDWFESRTLAGVFQPVERSSERRWVRTTPPHRLTRAEGAPRMAPSRRTCTRGALVHVAHLYTWHTCTRGTWQAHLYTAARELLYSGEWRPTPNMLTPPLRGELEKRTEPLLQLGSTLGEGSNGVVVEAQASAALMSACRPPPP